MKIKPRTRITWEECFMRMAEVLSERSPDPDTQVGAVIVNPDHVIVGAGYNGAPRGIDPNFIPWSRDGEFDETKYPYVVHAEENAIYNANGSVKGCKLYTTLIPCNECAKTIIQSGISELIVRDFRDDNIFKVSLKLFHQAGVAVRPYYKWKRD